MAVIINKHSVQLKSIKNAATFLKENGYALKEESGAEKEITVDGTKYSVKSMDRVYLRTGKDTVIEIK